MADDHPLRRGVAFLLVAALIVVPSIAVYWLLSRKIDDSSGASQTRSVDGRHVTCAIAWKVGARDLPECAGFYPKR